MIRSQRLDLDAFKLNACTINLDGRDRTGAGRRFDGSDRLCSERFQVSREYASGLERQDSDEGLRRVGEDGQAFRLEIPLGEGRVRLRQPNPLGTLAAELDPLREAERGLMRVNRIPVLGAAELFRLDRSLRVGEQASLQRERLPRSDFD